MVEIVDLAWRAVIDTLEIYTINSLIKQKFKTKFIMSKASFRVAQPKENEKVLSLLLKEVLGHLNLFFNKISF